ncbi:hypothetical protein [Flavobacterium inviolabile]|uniref:hypothetical protein n=1 Tax=Flavobacterium inviolabile TaxID=2748320 RepID=UPI0015AD1CFF|nr:hypothetical protein [Flavobacterium inviolabile]
MNYNIPAYLFFLAIMIFIIVRIGKICYQNGNIFVATLLPNHKELCQQINKVLLTGYYLINIGYCAMTLLNWEKITSLEMLFESVALKTSAIIFTLAALHYINIFAIKNYVQAIIQ